MSGTPSRGCSFRKKENEKHVVNYHNDSNNDSMKV